jgi:hypothetical protein
LIAGTWIRKTEHAAPAGKVVSRGRGNF